MSEEMGNRVCRVIADVLGVALERVTRATRAEEIREWDSMAIINITVAIEGEFNVSLTASDAMRLVSVDQVIEVVQEHLTSVR